MMDIFKRLIRWGRVTASGSDDKQFPVQQVEYMGKTADTLMLFPYGTHGNVPADALALMFAVQGDESNRAAIASTPQARPQMAAGENCFYHPPTGTIIHFKANGDIEVTATNDIKVTGKNVEVKADQVSVDAPQATFTGNVQINGNLTVNGNISGANISTTSGTGTATIAGNMQVNGTTTLGAVTSNGKNISDTHTHIGSPSAPSGPVSNTGAVV